MPRVWLLAEALFSECHSMPRATLDKVCFTECLLGKEPDYDCNYFLFRMALRSTGMHYDKLIMLM
jgi:hypothetical protein